MRDRMARTPASERSAPAKDVERAASGQEAAGPRNDDGMSQPEGLKARIQGLVQSLRAVTEVRLRLATFKSNGHPLLIKGGPLVVLQICSTATLALLPAMTQGHTSARTQLCCNLQRICKTKAWFMPSA